MVTNEQILNLVVSDLAMSLDNVRIVSKTCYNDLLSIVFEVDYGIKITDLPDDWEIVYVSNGLERDLRVLIHKWV